MIITIISLGSESQIKYASVLSSILLNTNIIVRTIINTSVRTEYDHSAVSDCNHCDSMTLVPHSDTEQMYYTYVIHL